MGRVCGIANIVFIDELELSIIMTLKSFLMAGIGKIVRYEGNK